MAEKKILIIDDEKPLLRALELKLSHAGFEVRTAGNGSEALHFVETETLDLILLDLLMPKMDGYAFLKKLQEANIHTPIIVLSNLGQREDFEKAKALGALEFFVKSDIPVADIVERIKMVLA